LTYVILLAAGLVVIQRVFVVVSFVVMKPFQGDFALYDVFARIGLRHGWHAVYDLNIQQLEWHAFGPTPYYPEIYPPPLGWLVAPFALMPFPLAIAVWTCLLVSALVLTWWLLAPAGPRWTRAAHLAVALALPPVAFGVLLGQVVALVALAIAGSWWLLRHQRPVAAGLLLSVITVKPQLAFLVPLALLAAGYRRAFMGFLMGSTVIGVVSLVTVGLDGLRTYGARLIDSTHTLPAYIVPVGRTLLGLLGGGTLAHVAQVAITAMLIVACWRRRGQGPEFPIAAGLTASLLVTPFMHDQDLGMLVVAGWLIIRSQAARERRLALTGILFSCLVSWNLPLVIVLVSWFPAFTRVRRRGAAEGGLPSGATPSGRPRLRLLDGMIPRQARGKMGSESARQPRREGPVEESPSSAEQGAG